jgi:hypothetical protein
MERSNMTKSMRTQAQIQKDIEKQSKKCSSCFIEKSFLFFRKTKQSKDGVDFWCKECAKKRANKDVERERKLKSKYNINGDLFRSLMEKQKNKCAICGTGEAGGAYNTMKVDHNHKTGEVRGLLCQHCNVGLGHFKDSPDNLMKAIRYLNESSS